MANRKFLWQSIRIPHRLMYKIGLAPIVGRVILLLTTTGRRTGKPHTTPLTYDEIDSLIYVGSARGQKADWFQNILADPNVKVQVKNRHFSATAEPSTDPHRIAEFLTLRLQKRPRFVGAITRAVGLAKDPTPAQLQEYAANRAMAVLRPMD